MLIRFTIKNWMSFKEKAIFSMTASKERQHRERIAYLKKYRIRLLPVAAIYGGNASGKTNFFKAFHFAKNFIVQGTQPDGNIPVESYKLDPAYNKKPSQFIFEISVSDTIYEYSFALTSNEILEEKLIKISSTTEKVLYHRKDNTIDFDRSLKNEKFLQFAFQGTRHNQLYLTNSVSQKVTIFKPVYDWFNSTLKLIAPDSRFGPFEHFIQEGHPLYLMMNSLLSRLDTGITKLGGEEIPIENIPISDPVKYILNSYIKEGYSLNMHNPTSPDKIIFFKKGGLLKAKKIITYHNSFDNKTIKFEIQNESDGTKRIIDLLPAFLELSAGANPNIYIIDELDRSLHTLLTRELIELFLGAYSRNSRSQLLFTTHDVLLMDQKLLRRDEMWVSERTKDGSSNLISFNEYKDIRYDKDIRKSYLQGRLGGIPHILVNNSCLFVKKGQ